MMRHRQGFLLAVYEAAGFCVFIAAGLVLAPSYRFLLDPDAVSYISIARKYASGNWQIAINAYWSPLVSWMLALSIKAGMDELFAFRLLMLSSGALAWRLAVCLLRIHLVSRSTRLIFSFTSFALILSWSLILYTPDMIALMLWLLLFRFLFSSSRYRFAVIALTGVLLYFTKSYNLVFFPIVTCCAFLIKRQAQRLPLILITFLAGILPWVLLLSMEQGHFTTGTAGKINLSMAWINDSQDHAIFRSGVTNFPDVMAVSSWDEPDPEDYPAITPAALNAGTIFVHVAKQLMQLLAMVLKIGVVPLVLVIALWWKKRSLHEESTLLLLACVFASGYAATWMIERYVWLLLLMLVIAGFVAFDRLRSDHPRRLQAGVAALLIISVLLLPVRRLFLQATKNKQTWATIDLISAAHLPPGSVVASDHDLFGPVLYASLLNGYRYAGMTPQPPECKERTVHVTGYFSARHHMNNSCYERVPLRQDLIRLHYYRPIE